MRLGKEGKAQSRVASRFRKSFFGKQKKCVVNKLGTKQVSYFLRLKRLPLLPLTLSLSYFLSSAHACPFLCDPIRRCKKNETKRRKKAPHQSFRRESVSQLSTGKKCRYHRRLLFLFLCYNFEFRVLILLSIVWSRNNTHNACKQREIWREQRPPVVQQQ